MHTTHTTTNRLAYLTLSVEALWLARVIQDALDVALAQQNHTLEPNRLKALRLNRDVFERLGIYGCSAERVSPQSSSWSAASRVELIRQVAVHWRAFIDTSFGSVVGAQLIQSLTDNEVQLLDQIQRFSRALQLHSAAITHCMQQQMRLMAQRQQTQQAHRCAVYLEAVDGKR